MKVLERSGVGFFARQALQLSLVGTDSGLDVHRQLDPDMRRQLQLSGDPHRQALIALYKARIQPLGLLDHLNVLKAPEDFLPDDLQLQLGKPYPDATMNAEAKGDMRAWPSPVDDELIRAIDDLFVAVSRNVPHHHLVALFDLLAPEFDVFQRGPAHMRQRRLPADHFRDETVDQLWPFTQLPELVRVFAQCIDAAGQRVAGGVVAADDQQDQVAEEVLGVHVARGFAVRHHREQIAFWRLVNALLPELPEILRALQQFALPLFFRRDQTGRTRYRCGDIGPARQFAAVLPREVEQHREHLRRQFDGYVINPVEHVIPGQMIEALGRALADVDRELVEMGRREHGRDGLAL